MVIDPKQTFIGYRCPHCGNGVISAVGVLTLGADLLKLKCECGGSELTVQKTSSGQIRLTVPCLLCPNPHNFTVSESLFFSKELFMLQCPYTDVDLCFLGELDEVSSGLERTNMELLDMLGAEEIENLIKANSERSSEEIFTDPQIYDIIMFVIGDLAEEKKINCLCDGGVCEKYGVEVLDDGIKVFCKNCGASQIIPTDSLLGAHAFLNCDRLNLE